MKTIKLYFLMLVVVLVAQNLQATNYEYFSAFSGIDIAKQKIHQLQYSNEKLLLIGAFAKIADTDTPNSALEGNTQNWSYLFAVNQDTKLVLISVVLQNGILKAEFVLESNSTDAVHLGYDDVYIDDFSELPQNLINSDSVKLQIYQNGLRKISINQPCEIHRFIIASVDNIHSQSEGMFKTEGYIWLIGTSCYDYEPLGTTGGWVICYVSAINGNELGCVASTDVGDEQEQQSSIQLLPNPASDFITISIPENSNHTLKGVVENRQLKVHIFNTLGIEVAQTPSSVYNGNVGENTTQTGASELLRIDISHLPTGVYFIKIGDNVEKFVKL